MTEGLSPCGEGSNTSRTSSIDLGPEVGVEVDLKEGDGRERVFPERSPKWWVPESFGAPGKPR